jgi:hypothetical protein
VIGWLRRRRQREFELLDELDEISDEISIEQAIALDAGELELAELLAQLRPTTRGVHVLPPLVDAEFSDYALPVDGVALDAEQLRRLRRPDLPPATDSRD